MSDNMTPPPLDPKMHCTELTHTITIPKSDIAGLVRIVDDNPDMAVQLVCVDEENAELGTIQEAAYGHECRVRSIAWRRNLVAICTTNDIRERIDKHNMAAGRVAVSRAIRRAGGIVDLKA